MQMHVPVFSFSIQLPAISQTLNTSTDVTDLTVSGVPKFENFLKEGTEGVVFGLNEAWF